MASDEIEGSNNKLSAKGDSNVQQVGTTNINGNVFLLDQLKLTHSDAFDLLEITINSDLPKTDSFKNSLPSEFTKKLLYNNVTKYCFIFSDEYQYQNIVSNAVEDLKDSAPLICQLRKAFLDNADYSKDGDLIVDNGDAQIDSIINKFLIVIKQDPNFLNSHISIESTEVFVRALIGYGIMKCKVLINPLERSNANATPR